MFAYCNNNPVNYFDPLGNDCICLHQRVHGRHVCNSKKPSSQSEEILSIDSFHNKDGSYSLYDNQRNHSQNPFHEQIIVIEPPSPPSFSSESVGLGSIGGDLITGGWEFEHVDLSLLDFGHVEASAEINRGISLGAMASVYSPSVSTKFCGITIELSAEILSVGAGFSTGRNRFYLAGAWGVGGSILISWE